MTTTPKTAKVLAGSFLAAATGLGGLYVYEQTAFEAPALDYSTLSYTTETRALSGWKKDGCIIYDLKAEQIIAIVAKPTYLAKPRADFCNKTQEQLIKRNNALLPTPLPRGLFGPWPQF